MSLPSPFLPEVGQLLVQWNFGTLGSITNNVVTGNIWLTDLPNQAVDACMLVVAPSQAPEVYIDHQWNVIDFWYRSNHVATAQSKIQTIYDLFHRRQQYSTANWYIFLSEALGQPQDMGYDEEGGKLFRLSIQFQCRNLNVIS